MQITEYNVPRVGFDSINGAQVSTLQAQNLNAQNDENIQKGNAAHAALFDHVVKEIDQTKVLNAQNALMQRINTLTNSETEGYTVLKADNALDRGDKGDLVNEYVGYFMDSYDEISKGLKNDRQRGAFTAWASGKQTEFIKGVEDHKAKQVVASKSNALIGTIAVSAEYALANRYSNLALVESMNNIAKASREQGLLSGVTDEETLALAVKQAQDSVATSIINAMLADEDESAAQNFIKDHGEYFTATGYEDARKLVDTAGTAKQSVVIAQSAISQQAAGGSKQPVEDAMLWANQNEYLQSKPKLLAAVLQQLGVQKSINEQAQSKAYGDAAKEAYDYYNSVRGKMPATAILSSYAIYVKAKRDMEPHAYAALVKMIESEAAAGTSLAAVDPTEYGLSLYNAFLGLRAAGKQEFVWLYNRERPGMSAALPKKYIDDIDVMYGEITKMKDQNIPYSDIHSLVTDRVLAHYNDNDASKYKAAIARFTRAAADAVATRQAREGQLPDNYIMETVDKLLNARLPLESGFPFRKQKTTSLVNLATMDVPAAFRAEAVAQYPNLTDGGLRDLYIAALRLAQEKRSYTEGVIPQLPDREDLRGYQ